MRILVVEDQSEKFAIVEAEIRKLFAATVTTIQQADSLAVAAKYIFENKYELIVVDLMMPLRSGELPQDISEEIISHIELSDRNRGANIIALSGYEDLVEAQRARFSEAGIILVHYDKEEEGWIRQISIALSRTHQQLFLDFLIVCALEKERGAFRSTDATVGELRNIRGLDCLHLQISGLRGICIKLPRMGLVEAAITTSRAIDLFRPKIISMSGICAGFPQEAAIGTLVVADPCWEYQAGKWADDGFKIEHYDACLDVNVRTVLSQFISRIGKGEVYKRNLLEEAVVFEEIKLAPMATGSAVIASGEKLASIKEQHRKIAAVEMEMYGVYKAAELSALHPIVFGAKTVVDLANSAKGDKYHEYGAILSARFVLGAIVELHTCLAAQTC